MMETVNPPSSNGGDGIEYLKKTGDKEEYLKEQEREVSRNLRKMADQVSEARKERERRKDRSNKAVFVGF